MTIVVDTSGWYASVVAADINHGTAQQFLKARHEFMITSEVFNEATALLHSRQGKKIALYSGDVMRRIGIGRGDESIRSQAWEFFAQTTQRVSYVDCVVIAVAKRASLPVFAFDKHFASFGVSVVPYMR